MMGLASHPIGLIFGNYLSSNTSHHHASDSLTVYLDFRAIAIPFRFRVSPCGAIIYN